MKILKQGIITFRAKCPICGCEFEYEREDIATEFKTWRRVKCPCCGEMIDHKETPEKIDITYENMPSIPYGKTLQYEGQEGPEEPSIEQPADINPLSKGLYDDVECPHCGAKDFTLGGSTCTAMYCHTIIRDGKVVENTDRNIHTTECICNKCGKRFKLVNGKVEK